MKLTNNKPEPKRLDELEAEFQTILAWYRGESHSPQAFERATFAVNAAVFAAAMTILCPTAAKLIAEAVAENATSQWWDFMMKDQGGFDRFDGKRPFGSYAFVTLARICRGRENMRHVTDRRITVRDPDDDRRNPDKEAERKPRIERRQVPLAFDPID